MNRRGFSLLAVIFGIAFSLSVIFLLSKLTGLPAIPPGKKPSGPSYFDNNLTKSHNEFGFNLFKELLSENTNGNVFISPTSVELALAMTLNGAGGETKTAMEKTLQLYGLELTDINEKSSALMNSLINLDPDIELLIANSLWAKTGYEFKEEFLNTNKEYFNAKITTLDFSKPLAIDTINNWVSDNTMGKIEKIIDDIPPEILSI